MGKAVLISTRPKWCELIAIGKKTVEVRKTAPKLPTPYKSYIYETIDSKYENIGIHDPSALLYKNFVHHPGKVIGEFVCDGIKKHWLNSSECRNLAEQSRVPASELHIYAQPKEWLFGWHISDLAIYDKPKELSEFYRWWNDGDDIRPCQNGKRCQHLIYDYTEDCQACAIDFDGTDCPFLKVNRPPQSWRYVEEL